MIKNMISDKNHHPGNLIGGIFVVFLLLFKNQSGLTDER